jgi:DNA helicase-2/ATP-dependent DNA helicase PcrA
VGSPLTLDTDENWTSIASEFALDSDEVEMTVDFSREALRYSIDMAKAGQMSFDDQIYCPTILGGSWTRYPRVLVDEAQDLNLLNHRMLSIVCTDLLAAVGDKRQAIYAFRGADSNSMENLKKLRPAWADHSLTLTFRCPRSIVARQQAHAPGYKAAPANIDGRVLDYPALDPEDDSGGGWNWPMLKSHLADIDRYGQLAILCRNNAPLVAMAFKLIRIGVGCQMLGRDIGSGLISLTNKIEKDDSISIVKFTDKLTKWLDKEIAIANANDKPERVDKLRDQTDCIFATIEGASPDTVGDLRSVIRRIFSRDNGQITLSSIHRAKGLEWPLVLHLDPWRIPSYFAKKAADEGDPSQLIQENNLRYVAETRTKHTLINANMEDFTS